MVMQFVWVVWAGRELDVHDLELGETDPRVCGYYSSLEGAKAATETFVARQTAERRELGWPSRKLAPSWSWTRQSDRSWMYVPNGDTEPYRITREAVDQPFYSES
jgi:hypothetical protein